MTTMTDYETCNWCKYKHDCSHRCAYPPLSMGGEEEGYRPSHTQEKHMNTYTITATAMYRNTYTVEANNEDDAINEVEWGNVDPDDSEFDGEISDVEVIDVEYGDIEYDAELTVNFVIRGNVGNNPGGEAKEALWNILATFDGKTTSCGEDGELEIVGFNVEAVNES